MEKKINIDSHTERTYGERSRTSRGGMNSKFRITLDTSADQPIGHVERSRDTVTPQEGKHYLIKIISEKLDNGKPDKLFGGGNFLAKYNGKFFFIGSLKRRRALHQVKVITEAVVNRGKL